MKKSLFAILFSVLVVAPICAEGKAACKDKRKAMHDARIALKDCNKSWSDSIRGNAADPSDDCSARQTAYVTGVKEFKTCLKEEKEKAKQ